MALLENKHVLITSGPTKCYIDAVRYISNMSTGALGKKIAIEALEQGAYVSMIHGNGSLVPEVGDIGGAEQARLKLIPIETNEDLQNALVVDRLCDGSKCDVDVVIHAMAVLDYVPAHVIDEKKSSVDNEWTIKLVKTPKVIKTIKQLWPKTMLVGFKLEVDKTNDELIEIAGPFLSNNNADFVVANDLNNIQNDRHKAIVIKKDCSEPAIFNDKDEIAKGLIELIAQEMQKRKTSSVKS